ncbi:hypothetical protein BT69DRAFT_1281600 [Atractiella rhizophila]|nr:hypothetical protein BT69DRAFT_1281600 [Atractiella rhizophila]
MHSPHRPQPRPPSFHPHTLPPPRPRTIQTPSPTLSRRWNRTPADDRASLRPDPSSMAPRQGEAAG